MVIAINVGSSLNEGPLLNPQDSTAPLKERTTYNQAPGKQPLPAIPTPDP